VTPALPVPRIVVDDVEALDRRAAALAAPPPDEAHTDVLRVVVFRLGATTCAVEAAAVERAVVALASPFAVPLASGGDRTVAFVEERPVPVVDLVAFAAAGGGASARHSGDARAPDARPALVLRTADGPVAALVDGPLELAEDRLTATAIEDSGAAAAGVLLAGRLAGGGALVDAAWLAAWAWKAARA
jgi:chemotaxis signal transduction protein